MITVYGLKNCDACRKALRWLADNGLAHRFHDFRADGLEAGRIAGWIAAVGPEALVNRRSTTWRQLDDAERAAALGGQAENFLADHATLIKRPLIEAGGEVLSGFSAATMEALRRQGLK